MGRLVSNIYSDSILNLAKEKNIIDDLFKETILIKTLLKEKKIINILNNYKLSKEYKIKFLENLLKDKVSEYIFNLLCVLIDKNHIKDIINTLNSVILKIKKLKKIYSVKITTSFNITDNQKKLLEDKIIKTIKCNKLESTYILDKNILGGIIIKFGNKIFDTSINNKLENISKYLKTSIINNNC